MRYDNRVFKKSRQVLDGNEYHGCEFDHCEIIYGGGELPILDTCVIHHSHFALEGAAERTISYLAGIYKGLGTDGQTIVEGILANVRGNAPPSKPRIH